VAGHADPEAADLRKKVKTCESCGKVFVCRQGGCWCDALKLTHLTIEALRIKYQDCLCEECLKALPGGPS
jgi:hypothetical protein